MWRVIPFLAVVCLCGTLFGQPLIEPREEQVPFDAHQIEQAAVKSFADLEAKVIKLEAENESLRQQIRELTKGKEPTPAVDKAARNQPLASALCPWSIPGSVGVRLSTDP